MTFAVSIGYVQGCDQCRRIVESTQAAALRDPSVSSFRSTPGKIHNHETPEGGKAISDTNGSHPALVEATLFPSADTPALGPYSEVN